MLRVVGFIAVILLIWYAIVEIAKLLPVKSKEPERPCSPLEDLDKTATEIAKKKSDIKEETDAIQEKINDINKKIN